MKKTIGMMTNKFKDDIMKMLALAVAVISIILMSFNLDNWSLAVAWAVAFAGWMALSFKE